MCLLLTVGPGYNAIILYDTSPIVMKSNFGMNLLKKKSYARTMKTY